MIYSWKVEIEKEEYTYNSTVAAEDAQVTDSGAIVFYVDGKVVHAFWDWVSVERLPSE